VKSRRGALVLLVAITGCSVSGPATSGVSQSGQAPVVVGETSYPVGQRPLVAALSGPTLTGSTLSLQSLIGNIVVLNAWASWCDPCRQESPDLAKVSRALAAAGVRFVGLDEQDITSHAIAFAKQVGADYPHLIDSDGSLLVKLAIVPPAAIPSTLVIDRTGHVAARFIGATTAAKLTVVLKRVLAGK